MAYISHESLKSISQNVRATVLKRIDNQNVYFETRCVEILIAEQFRRYTEKMQNIQQLEYAEALAINQLRLRRQNTVRKHNSQQ